MKYILFFLSVMFFFFASLQFNDPDPMRWILIYSSLGAFSALTALGKTRTYLRYALLAGLAISGIWMVSLLPDFLFWIDMGTPNIFSSWNEDLTMIELTREFLGLGICTFISGFYLYLYSSRVQVREIHQQAMA